MLQINRSADSRVGKSILHRIADIPGGVTVSIAALGGTSLKEGTPLGVGSNGMYAVVKTVRFVTEAANDATSYEVEKGHHFKVGDYIATGSANGKAITAIDKTTSSAKDTITVGTTLGVAVAVADVAYQVAGANKTLVTTPTAIAGSNYDITAGESLLCDAWLFAVVKGANAPGVTDTLKTTLKGIIYL